VTPPAMTAAGRVPGRVSTTRVPRRLSGPLTGRPAPSRDRPISAPRRGTLGVRTLEVVRSLPDRALIDRLVRGRAWIPVVGVLLAGIVAMQVEILKLGTATGRSMERSTALEARNESLQASVATLADDQRIERLAAGMGMVTPAPTTVVFLSARSGGAVGRAIANIHAPDPTGFSAQLAAQVAAAAALTQGPATNAATTTAAPATGAAPVAGPAPGTSAATSGSAAPASSPASTPATGSPASGSAPPVTSAPASAPAPASPGTAQPASAATGGGTSSTSPAQAPATGAAGVAPPGSGQSGSAGGG
jgi:hypothetical protein